MTMKIMLDLICEVYGEWKSSEVCLHSAYLPARAQLVFCMKLCFSMRDEASSCSSNRQRMKEMRNRAITALKNWRKKHVSNSQHSGKPGLFSAYKIMWIFFSNVFIFTSHGRMLDTVATVGHKNHKSIEASEHAKVLYICKINMRLNLVGKEPELESSHLAVNVSSNCKNFQIWFLTLILRNTPLISQIIVRRKPNT